MNQASQEAVSKAVKSTMHRVKHWAPGQWVYVFRRAKPGNDLHPRDRWVGPGVVILSNNHTTYVGMRSRLWRCSADQLRPALPAEVLGMEVASDPGLQDLLHQIASSSRVGAVAVDKEGPPSAEHSLLPVDAVDGAGELPEETPIPDEEEHPTTSGPAAPNVAASPVSVSQTPGHATSATGTAQTRRPGAGLEPSARPMSQRRISDVTVEEPSLEPPPEPTLLPVAEEENTDSGFEPTEPAVKQPRLLPPEERGQSSVSSSSTATEGPPPGLPQPVEHETRAPGTPVAPLLTGAGQMSRDDIERLFAQRNRTPGEQLGSIHGRVAHQVAEIENRPDAVRDNNADPIEIPDSTSRSRSNSPHVSVSSNSSISFLAFQQGMQVQHLPLLEGDELCYNFLSEGWSGSIYNYILGKDDYVLEDGEWVLLAKRNGETDVKKLPEAEKRMFEKSDLTEWESIVSTGAVTIHVGDVAAKLREEFSSRILSSRMVRRKKPTPGIGCWKAKSRWCVHGHTDPDLGQLSTYSPTPSTESIMLFLQSSLNCDLRLSFADVKNAFCQSRPLQRAAGRLFAEPCEGLQLQPGAIIELNIPVYGLEDAPYEWRATVLDHLTSKLQFRQSILEPCWLSHYDSRGQLDAQILVGSG